jgi:hypothetical protein
VHSLDDRKLLEQSGSARHLFNDLVGQRQKFFRQLDAGSLRGLQVDNQLVA